jgi:hypothetical protein
MDPVITLALTKAIEGKIAKAARDNVAPGRYDLSFDAHITGTLTVGADYEQRLPNKAKPWHLVVALMQELNAQRAAAGQMGVDMARLVAMAETIDENLVKEAQFQAEVEAAKIKAGTLTPCKGKVTADLQVTEIVQSAS